MFTRAPAWKLRSRTIQFDEFPKLMGILNVTPDSFSDGGEFFEVDRAVEHAIQLVNSGAEIIDIGGESTRPYSQGVDVEEELQRTIPVVSAVCQAVDVPVSIDTSKAVVARQALASGAEIINDVTGLEGDSEMVQVARESGAGVCVMHMQGTVQTMQDQPQYDQVVEEVLQYLVDRKANLIQAGIEAGKICLDPGIGFGKTHAHNLELIRQANRFLETESPILVGHSRKGFIGKMLGDPDIERDSASLGIALHLARVGVQVIRVHEVARCKRAMQAYFAVQG